MFSDPRLWWFVSRSTGLVAWAVLCALTAFGLLLSSRVLRPTDRPAWLLSMHRHLAALFVVTTAAHLGALVADSFVDFGPRELFVPMASEWHPVPVAFGVVALYYVLVIQVSSLLMKRLNRNLWRGIHMTSYVAFLLVTVHGFAAGSDARSPLVLVPATALLSAVAVLAAMRLLLLRSRTPSQRVRVTASAETISTEPPVGS